MCVYVYTCVYVHMYVYAGKKACPNSISVDVTLGEFDWEGPSPRERAACISLESVNELKHH